MKVKFVVTGIFLSATLAFANAIKAETTYLDDGIRPLFTEKRLQGVRKYKNVTIGSDAYYDLSEAAMDTAQEEKMQDAFMDFKETVRKKVQSLRETLQNTRQDKKMDAYWRNRQVKLFEEWAVQYEKVQMAWFDLLLEEAYLKSFEPRLMGDSKFGRGITRQLTTGLEKKIAELKTEKLY